jgi:hypothetical protein
MLQTVIQKFQEMAGQFVFTEDVTHARSNTGIVGSNPT